MAWLHMVAHRSEGSTLFSADGAKMVREFFPNVLDCLANQKEEANEDAQEPESGDEAVEAS